MEIGLSDALARVQAAHERADALRKSKRAASSRKDQRQITIKIDAGTLQAVEARAHRAGTPRNAYIHEMLLHGMAATMSAPPALQQPEVTGSQRTQCQRTQYQAAMLRGLEGLGVDVTPAQNLQGLELDAWITEAEEAGFKKEFAEFQAQAAAFKAQFTKN